MICATCGAELADGAFFCGECGAVVAVARPPAPASEPVEFVPDRLGAPTEVVLPPALFAPLREATEPARLREPAPEAAAAPRPGSRYVLQFSTGESITVTGSGLVGRSPVPQPGEVFDHLVAVADVARSVSKTHLEFGQDATGFWISDRFSTNGTVATEPDGPVRRCEPGRRVHVVRGTRVGIGEQFFIVS